VGTAPSTRDISYLKLAAQGTVDAASQAQRRISVPHSVYITYLIGGPEGGEKVNCLGTRVPKVGRY